MTPSNNTDYSGRGWLVPIGGAEEKFDNPEILDQARCCTWTLAGLRA